MRAASEHLQDGLFGRLTRAFIVPAEGEERVTALEADATSPAAVAVLCRPEDAWAVGGAVALGVGTLAGGQGAAATRGPRIAVVAARGPGLVLSAARAPATPTARKVAALLRSRGHEAAATGRLVHVLLGDGVATEAGRIAAATSRPCVTAVASPRDDRIDELLRAQGRVLVAAAEPIADLALTSLAAADVPARCLTISNASAASRALAAAGVALVPPLRAMVEEGLR